jgi:hypothetical protein
MMFEYYRVEEREVCCGPKPNSRKGLTSRSSGQVSDECICRRILDNASQFRSQSASNCVDALNALCFVSRPLRYATRKVARSTASA